jgi:CO/xanthine dehydrogenase Mo-binding subunit
VHGRDRVSRAELALDANGKVLALRVRSLANVGAYGDDHRRVIQVLIGPWVSTSIYDIPVIDCTSRRGADATPRHRRLPRRRPARGDLH